MAKNRGKLIGFFLLLLVLAYFLIKKEKIVVTEDAMAKMEDYDIILTQGQSVHSRLVGLLNLTNEDYSHIGILIREGEKVFVLHATPDGTKTNGIRYDELNTFMALSDVCGYTLLRHRNLSDKPDKRLRTEFDMAKSTVAPFDYDFDAIHNDKIYCSELVCMIFQQSGLMDSNAMDLSQPIFPRDFLGFAFLEEVR